MKQTDVRWRIGHAAPTSPKLNEDIGQPKLKILASYAGSLIESGRFGGPTVDRFSHIAGAAE
jgi:hypothetical protein